MQEIGQMGMQVLRLPVDRAVVTAGYKNIAYRDHFRFHHYGCDYYDPSGIVRAPGRGRVLAAGRDSIYGGVVVLRLDMSYVPHTGQVLDLAVRFYHMDRVGVDAGDIVDPGDRLGRLGNSGQTSTGPHLHVEISLDADHYDRVPGLVGSSTFFEAGPDRTINPAWVFTLAPGQTITRQDEIFSTAEDTWLPNWQNPYEDPCWEIAES